MSLRITLCAVVAYALVACATTAAPHRPQTDDGFRATLARGCSTVAACDALYAAAVERHERADSLGDRAWSDATNDDMGTAFRLRELARQSEAEAAASASESRYRASKESAIEAEQRASAVDEHAHWVEKESRCAESRETRRVASKRVAEVRKWISEHCTGGEPVVLRPLTTRDRLAVDPNGRLYVNPGAVPMQVRAPYVCKPQEPEEVRSMLDRYMTSKTPEELADDDCAVVDARARAVRN